MLIPTVSVIGSDAGGAEGQVSGAARSHVQEEDPQNPRRYVG